MNTEHACEWEWQWCYIRCKHCKVTLHNQDAIARLNEYETLKKENEALGELLSPLVDIELERDTLKKATEELKRWIGAMHTPAYGEWSEDKIGYWTRGAHIFGTPQIENMCRELVEAYADALAG